MSTSETGAPRRLRLFEATGIELEYMIVDRETLAVRPISDRLLAAAAGSIVSDVERGEIAWSNELVLHVIELKTNGPAARLETLPAAFGADVRAIDELLAPMGARLMPTAMHPWMDPFAETRLWPHDASPVYEQFNRIFDCRGHGWSNLQSMHVNLPFADDEQFKRLHAAIRLVLPILPALSASSPIVDGKATGSHDNRLRFYRTNSARVPSLAGKVVPEPYYDRASYEGVLLASLYRDIAPHDPEGVLQHEFLNARGAIARFDRHAIEIRVLDIQECPLADIAIAALVRAVLRALCSERWQSLEELAAWDTLELASILWEVVDRSDLAIVRDRRYLESLGLEGRESASAGELWAHLAAAVLPHDSPEWTAFGGALRVLFERGTLARRILAATGPAPSRAELARVYGELCECLREGRMFLGAGA